jgi:hypothetical protein
MLGQNMQLSEVFGGEESNSSQRITLYLANKNSKSESVKKIDDWLSAGMKLLTEINGGCTAYYNLPGTFKYMDNENIIRRISENTHVLYSYIFNSDDFALYSYKIRNFMYDYGFKTDQNAIMIEYSGPNSFGTYQSSSTYVEMTEIINFRNKNKKAFNKLKFGIDF